MIATIGSEDLKVLAQAHDQVNLWSEVCVIFHGGSVKGDKNVTLPSKVLRKASTKDITKLFIEYLSNVSVFFRQDL